MLKVVDWRSYWQKPLHSSFPYQITLSFQLLMEKNSIIKKFMLWELSPSIYQGRFCHCRKATHTLCPGIEEAQHSWPAATLSPWKAIKRKRFWSPCSLLGKVLQEDDHHAISMSLECEISFHTFKFKEIYHLYSMDNWKSLPCEGGDLMKRH